MIYIIDKSVINEVHVVFNSAMLKLIRMTYPDEQIIFEADATHTNLVLERLSPEDKKGIVTNPLKITLSFSNGIKKIFEWMAKLFNDGLFFFKLLKKINSENDTLFLLNVPPMSFVLFKIVKIFSPSKKVFIVLHGELEYMYYSNDKREKGIGILYKLMFNVKNKNVKYILLNKIIKGYLTKDGFIKENQAVEINHPYIFKDEFDFNIKLNNRIILANVGGLVPRKNGHRIFELASKLENAIRNKLVEIKTIGSVDVSLLELDNGLVSGIPEKAENVYNIERTQFESLVKGIDFSLFFFDNTQFVFRASGTILDIVNYARPIIALRHPLFESLFKECGNFGFLCDNIDEMKDLIEEISINKEKYNLQYESFVMNALKLKEIMSLESIRNDFLNQINMLNK